MARKRASNTASVEFYNKDFAVSTSLDKFGPTPFENVELCSASRVEGVCMHGITLHGLWLGRCGGEEHRRQQQMLEGLRVLVVLHSEC